MATQISVASVTYPLYGATVPPNYLRSLITGHQIMKSSGSYAESIVKGTINGSGLRMLKYARWAERGDYGSLVGMTSAQILGPDAVNEDTIKTVLREQPGDTIEIISSDVSEADTYFWAVSWMGENHPDRASEPYLYDTNETNTALIITMPNGDVFTAPLTGFVSTSRYLYVNYTIQHPPVVPPEGGPGVVQPIVTKWYKYREGSGQPNLDLFFATGSAFGRVFPIIPIINNGRFISSTYLPTYYPYMKAAVRKAFPAGNYDKLVNDIRNGNSKVGDIDYANIVFGIPLNTHTMEGKQYTFELMRRILSTINTSWTIQPSGSYNISYQSSFVGKWTGLRWTRIWPYRTDPGNFRGLKVGEVMLIPSDAGVTMFRQTTASYYNSIMLQTFMYVDNVYKTKSVGVYAQYALTGLVDDVFMVPLDIDIVQELGLVSANEFCNQVAHITFNCYEVKKTKWYQDGFFNILVFVVVVVISIVTVGAGAGAAGGGTGILGSSVAIGTALGFSGTLALVVGTLANYLAAMVLVKIIQAGSQKLFGDEIGTIIGNIAAMVAVSYGTAMANGTSMSTAFPDLSDPVNLIKFSASVGGGFDSILQRDPESYAREIAQFQDQITKRQRELDRLYEENLSSAYDLLSMHQVSRNSTEALESMESFLTRTLMTGDDVIRVSQGLLDNFAQSTTEVSLPG